MRDISYDLIDKLKRYEKEADPSDRVLNDNTAGEYLYALTPIREDLILSIDLGPDDEVMQYGADYGCFTRILSDRVSSVDVYDPRYERSEVIRTRYPELTDPERGNVKLLKKIPSKTYDLVICTEMKKEMMGDRGESPESFIRFLATFVKPGGRLFFAVDNTFSLRTFLGAENDSDNISMEYSELLKLRDMLIEEGLFKRADIYYPLPDKDLPKSIYSDEYMPGKGDFKTVSDAFFRDRYLFGDEEGLYNIISESGDAVKRLVPSYLVLFGPRKDTKQVFIKFNKTRRPEYRISTAITEELRPESAKNSGHGRRYVVKKALSPEGNDHIESLYRKYEILMGDKGRDPRLHIPEPFITEDEAGLLEARFDYIEGRTVADILAEEIYEGQAPAIGLRDAIEFMLGVGIHECRNMDCLLENVMKRGDEYFLLDYEWVFEEAVDKGYLRYRMLKYWYEAYRNELYAYRDEEEFLESFGMSAEDIRDYDKMERSFQTFVHGDEKQGYLETYRKKITGRSEILEHEAELPKARQRILELQDEVEEKNANLRKDIEMMRLSDNHIHNLENVIKIHETDIANMSAQLEYLKAHEGISSKLFRKFSELLESKFPRGTRKRKVLTYISQTVKHPVKYIKMYLSSEGRNLIEGDFNIGSEYAEAGKLKLPQTEEPLVSIIIPCYNQVGYTYSCIRSILENTDETKTPYEIVIADDVSQDATAEIGKYIEGLVISRNTENQGFLKNCNHAVEKARGKYLFFLNNDTKVTENWLCPLLKLIEEDESIGLVGSKLIYPDGRLQEAGGIIWSDGSGWNYGRLDDPEKPDYNYVKEVDYISGAAIMISRSLWDEIGGFDERYAPAYCEDSDLAFEVRKHGKRVVYQPQSVVIHFEGVSNGTDVEGTGLKQYQKVNQEKFRAKWAEELKSQSENTGNPNPFKARDRSQGKKCILVIDHYVPTWDKDAGSKTTLQYLKMFLKKGYSVKFLGDNFLHEEPYTSELEQMGIEVLYGAYYQTEIWDYIKKNKDMIDIAYLNRPHIAIKYIEFIKDNTDIKCIYYGHDLHFMRLMREYELTDDIKIKREADYWKNIEFTVMYKADMSYYPSQLEVDAIHAIDETVKVKAITAYVFEDFKERKNRDYAKREGLLFVGGFAHPPNSDGVLWFAKDIFPKIREKLPNINFYIAGSKAGDEIKALGKDPEETGINVLGFVSDEELSELYDRTKITVVPLRYGAGVKGKVVEALYNGSCIVTTSVGAEGIPEAGSVMLISDSDPSDIGERPEKVAESFAELCVRLYDSDRECEALSAKTESFIKKYYSLEAAWDIIKDDFK